jgi:hypothetical protein
MDIGTVLQTAAAAILIGICPYIYYFRGAISAEVEDTDNWDIISLPEPQPDTHYLSSSQGLSRYLNSADRRALWKRAIQYITTAILLRRRFWPAGERLKDPRLQDLYRGIERVKGIVKRVRDADTGVRITRNR